MDQPCHQSNEGRCAQLRGLKYGLAPYRAARYQLGFNPKVLVEPKRIIRDLIPGSAAERAGLRNGGEITQPVLQNRIQGDQQALLTLKLLRDGKPLELSYLPRGEEVEAYQWMRTGNLPDSACTF